ncbi:MAG: nucleoside-diphosphate kinase [Streblomastix strix]|uniref:Nucleoside-diphosphate kinase n=1 Tax=Streblomastix strix TaxID=222440 RepID=A0A5J4UL70_9EUKA|nr:MAG: nucleoside-diphosphate kinase [Streblomastix strix]
MNLSQLGDPDDIRYAFDVIWYDALASLNREFALLFYKKDSSIEMIDKKSHKNFVKRSVYPDLKLSDLYIGATVLVFGRQLRIMDYSDDYTRDALGNMKEPTILLVRPEAYTHTGEILDFIIKDGFVVSEMKTLILSETECRELFAPTKILSQQLYDQACTTCAERVSVAVELLGPKAVKRVRDLVGPTSVEDAKGKDPHSLRAKFGVSGAKNAMYSSIDPQKAEQDFRLLFQTPRNPTALLQNCTIGIILPHAISNGNLGAILQQIQDDGFMISAMQMFQLEKKDAAEFYEVYQTVIPEYPKMVDELCNGHSLAIEITGSRQGGESQGDEIIKIFRDYVGPVDPEVAKTLRPQSIRSRFGVNRVRNSIHCTDLPEDGMLESEYFFAIMQS